MKAILQKLWSYFVEYAEIKAQHYHRIHTHSRYI